jgi:hypothetical protein
MQKVQKVGCGTGRNFPYLREAIGPTRRIYGVDRGHASEGAQAERSSWIDSDGEKTRRVFEEANARYEAANAGIGPAWTSARGRARVYMADSKPRSVQAQSQLRPRA